MDRVARITLALGGFMMILLIAVPFTFESGTSGYFASYVIYSLFLTLSLIHILTLPTTPYV